MRAFEISLVEPCRTGEARGPVTRCLPADVIAESFAQILRRLLIRSNRTIPIPL